MNIMVKNPSYREAGQTAYHDAKGYICAYCALTSVSQGQPLMLIGDASLTNSPRAIAPTLQTAEVTDPLRLIVVALQDIDAAGWYWFQFQGNAEALCYNIAGANDTFKVANGGTYFIADSASGVASKCTVGISREAQATTASVLTDVYLYGYPVWIDRFTTASAALAGVIKTTYSSTGAKDYICAYSAAKTVAAGTPLVISSDADGTTPLTFTAITPAALAVYQHVVVCETALTAAGWAWFTIKGAATALVDGDTADVTIGDYLEVIAAGTAFTLDHASARSVNSVAVALAANASTAALKSVFLIGERVIVAGS